MIGVKFIWICLNGVKFIWICLNGVKFVYIKKFPFLIVCDTKEFKKFVQDLMSKGRNINVPIMLPKISLEDPHSNT